MTDLTSESTLTYAKSKRVPLRLQSHLECCSAFNGAFNGTYVSRHTVVCRAAQEAGM